MMTRCAKNMTRDPSPLVQLSQTPSIVPPVPVDSVRRDALSDLLEELHVMSQEQEQEQEPESLSVHLLEREYPLFTMEDDQQQNPYYVFHIEVKKEGDLQEVALYSYRFLFRLLDGTFYPPSAWAIEEEDGYPSIVFPFGNKGVPSLDEMLTEERGLYSVPPRYLEHMRRAMGRKWIRLLRRMGQFRPEERRLRVIYPSETIPHEKQRWKEHYWTMKSRSIFARQAL